VSNFSRVSLLEEKADLRKVFDDALVVWKPNNVVMSAPEFGVTMYRIMTAHQFIDFCSQS